MKPAIDIIGADGCTGCFGCFNSCPSDAITMKISPEGFYVPTIDRERCTECGLCQKYCPVIFVDEPLEEEYSPKCFAAWCMDEQTRLESSSGGIFTSLATKVISSGGTVFGAAWNSVLLVEHIGVEAIDSLCSLRGSKYLQSSIGRSFIEAANLLEKGKPVLFSGTPCQIAAMKIFAESDLLITVDVICHGVPSITAFQKYLELRSNKRKVSKVNFRDKRTGWSKFSIVIEFDDSSIYTRRFTFDDFCWGFNNNYYLNNVCYECPFSRLPRRSDITLGDFWGAPKDLRDDKGLSVAIINTTKGEALFDDVSKIQKIPVSLDMIAKGNPRLIDGEQRHPRLREMLLKELSNNDFGYIARKYLKHPGEFESFLKGVIYRLLRKLKMKR